MRCLDGISKLPIECKHYNKYNHYQHVESIRIIGNKCFYKKEYIGKVIEKGDNYIKIECSNNSIFIKGQIINVIINDTNRSKA